MIPLNDKFFIKNFENGTENIVEKNCKIYYNMDINSFESDARSLSLNCSLCFENSTNPTGPCDTHMESFRVTRD